LQKLASLLWLQDGSVHLYFMPRMVLSERLWFFWRLSGLLSGVGSMARALYLDVVFNAFPFLPAFVTADSPFFLGQAEARSPFFAVANIGRTWQC